MIVSINKIYDIADDSGKFGPQKKIKFVDSKGTTISGWIPLGEFDPSVWVVGGQVDIDLKQNGKYVNFSMVKRNKPQVSGGDDVIGALREIFKVLKSIDEKLTRNGSQAPDYPEVLRDSDLF